MDADNKSLATLKKLMAAQVKLDIALALRHHPHLQGEASQDAYAALANDATVEQLVSDMAHEEVLASVARGELPSAAFLQLAGFRPNRMSEG